MFIPQELSSSSVPEGLLNIAVGCYECHSLNATNHQDNFEHFDYQINVVVSPRDCATCHQDEVEQYLPSKKANAYYNLKKNVVYHKLVETITSVKDFQDGNILQLESSANAKAETCSQCHLEQKWILQWLFYANSVRYASARMGPDYAAFKNGWWYLTNNLLELKDAIALKSALKK